MTSGQFTDNGHSESFAKENSDILRDNDRTLMSKSVVEAWGRYGISFLPGAGKVWVKGRGGFPVNHPIYNPLDQNIHHTWKCLENGFYDK